MNPDELGQCYRVLGVESGISLPELERAFMKKNFALLKGRSGAADEVNPGLEVERQQLRAAYEHLAEHLRGELQAREKMTPRVPGSVVASRPAGLITPPVVRPRDPADDEFVLFTFDNWRVNLFVPPLLLALVLLVNLSPLGFFLHGFQVWMHEFGHATAAWMTGHRALPLPFGWTPVEAEHSNFVYFGLLLLFAILFGAGWKERVIWPMIAAVSLAGLQFFLTWRLSDLRQEFWWGAFGGVGGEFYLGTLFMMFFFVRLPEKFKWGACRYVFFLIGATAFLNICLRWRDIYHGLEEIPFGSMINGEDDKGGDMNRLMDDFGWTKAMIRRNYHLLGNGCWIALATVYAIFALRLNLAADWIFAKFFRPETPAEGARLNGR